MLDPDQVPDVAPDETVARFILFSKHFRPSDGTVKPDAFIPHPRLELSLTRHIQATEAELWEEGVRVSRLRNVNLHGRADLGVHVFLKEGLSVESRPIPDNPNHADVTGWPMEKDAQKMKALVIASKSQFLPGPRGGDSGTH